MSLDLRLHGNPGVFPTWEDGYHVVGTTDMGTERKWEAWSLDMAGPGLGVRAKPTPADLGWGVCWLRNQPSRWAGTSRQLVSIRNPRLCIQRWNRKDAFAY